ncbi:hypothetical protein V1525DRAFT_163148 [Lipomyces kononenkoae]|uniref:Uncharacterized protein n=1 Tax=Lipomyces kononenkoae TaxID=34357 RepID=A0ACC3T0W3_LIPKO
MSDRLSCSTRKSTPNDSIQTQKQHRDVKVLLQSNVSQNSVSSPQTFEAYRNMTPLQQANELRRLENEHQWQNQQQNLEQGYHTGMSAHSQLKSNKDPWMNPQVDDSASELAPTLKTGSHSPSKRIAKYHDVPKLRLTTASGHTTTPSHDSSALAALDKLTANDEDPNLKKKPSSWRLMFGRKSRDPEQREVLPSPKVTSSPNEHQLHRKSASISPHKTIRPAISFQDMPSQNQNFRLPVARNSTVFCILRLLGPHAKNVAATMDNLTNSPRSEHSLDTWIEDDLRREVRQMHPHETCGYRP